jgi:signal transduction histidine kinase
MTLVRELLEVNRIRAGQLQFKWQESNIVDIIKQTINDLIQRFPDREITLKNNLGMSGTIIGDTEMLMKVFDNVLDNALKYSPAESLVRVSLIKNNSFFIIVIQDEGRGIDAKDLPYVFTGQHKGESGEEGMGIGLLFVENIIRQHRGDISIKSKLKRGTTVTIKLPTSKL